MVGVRYAKSGQWRTPINVRYDIIGSAQVQSSKLSPVRVNNW